LALMVVLALGAGTPEPGTGAAPPVQPPDGKPPADASDEPLPPEAVARLGSLRLRGAAIGYADDDRTIVSATDGKALQFWDAATGELRRTIPVKLDSVHARAISADGQLLHLVSNDTYVALELRSGKERRRLVLPNDVQSPFFALVTDGTLVVLSSSRKQ